MSVTYTYAPEATPVVRKKVKTVKTTVQPEAATIVQPEAKQEVKRKPLPKVAAIHPSLGSDPELFFRKGKQILGAELLLPREGLKVFEGVHETKSKWTIDGVQAELNPSVHTCRSSMASAISTSFRSLIQELKKKDPEVTLDFSQAVEVGEADLAQLSEESRKFGCMPSLSIYDTSKDIQINQVDPSQYRIRAAGGHVHIGVDNYPQLVPALTTRCKETVQLLDIIAGNTAVIIDRSRANIERRKLYGRAGEYRLPAHGLEYRTLSNFWLYDSRLMSLMMGLVRLAVQLSADANHKQYYEAFFSAVPQEAIRQAINTNDLEMAMDNFLQIVPLLTQVTVNNEYGEHPVNATNIADFYFFADKIVEKGLTHWFKEEPSVHWQREDLYSASGFSNFLKNTVNPERKKAA